MSAIASSSAASAGELNNNSNPLMTFPNALLLRISQLLSPRLLFKTALTCRRWRALLLASPRLWARIRIAFGQHRHHWNLHDDAAAHPEFWMHVLSLLLERSKGLPLDLAVQIGDDYTDPEAGELSRVCDLLCDNMHRVQSLGLTTPGWDQPGLTIQSTAEDKVPAFLLERAPILERFRLNITSQGVVLPKALFAYTAPCLREVEILGAILPVSATPTGALRNVTTFIFEWPGGAEDPLDDEFITGLLEDLPALERLTVIAEKLDRPSSPCLEPLESVHISVRSGAWDAYRAFPNAKAIAYSLYGSKPAPARQNLSTILRTQKEITSLDMRLTFTCVQSAYVRMALKANGVLVATDMDWDPLAPTIFSAVPFSKIQKLVVPELVWPTFVSAAMPRLTDLTVHVRRRGFVGWDRDPWPLAAGAGPRWENISMLRFARIRVFEGGLRHPVDRELLSTLPSAQIAAFIRRKLVPAKLTKLVLQGWELGDPGLDELFELLPETEFVIEDEIACDDWEPLDPWTHRFQEWQAIEL